MLKYLNTGIVFQEIPDEVTLSINITNCPCRCPHCHSQYLWRDIGNFLTSEVIDSFIKDYGEEITCICFMGGDSNPEYVVCLASYIHFKYASLKVAWYSGRIRIPSSINKTVFDYIKVGPYIEHLGGLKEKTTNQRLYKKNADDTFIDITSLFWKHSL